MRPAAEIKEALLTTLKKVEESLGSEADNPDVPNSNTSLSNASRTLTRPCRRNRNPVHRPQQTLRKHPKVVVQNELVPAASLPDTLIGVKLGAPEMALEFLY